LQDAERLVVVGGHDRGRPVRQAQQAGRLATAAAHRERVAADQPVVHGQPGLEPGRAVAVLAGLGQEKASPEEQVHHAETERGTGLVPMPTASSLSVDFTAHPSRAPHWHHRPPRQDGRRPRSFRHPEIIAVDSGFVVDRGHWASVPE
jgi:hypothetical protein